MNDFEEFNVTPELTLDPFQEGKKKRLRRFIRRQNRKHRKIVLTPEEKNMVSAFAEKIDLANSNMILQYGAGTQKKIAEFFRKSTGKCKNKRSWRGWHTVK